MAVSQRPLWQTVPVRVYLGSDHAGLELKTALIAWLREAGHEPVDCGPASYDPEDDYPGYVMRAAQGTVGDPGSLGIVVGGSGNGEQIASNKIPGVRALDGGPLQNARIVEQITALLIGMNIRYKGHAGIRITGLPPTAYR